jgi:hypothetical protein
MPVTVLRVTVHSFTKLWFGSVARSYESQRADVADTTQDTVPMSEALLDTGFSMHCTAAQAVA